MSEKEIGSQRSTNEQLNQAECSVVHGECQEARDQLDREICLQNLVDQLGIECTEQEKALLIPTLIEKEKTLPKLLTELPSPVASIQIAQVLPTIKAAAVEQALANEEALLKSDSEALADRKLAKVELTQEQQQKLERHEQDKTTIDVIAQSNIEKDSTNNGIDDLKKLQVEKIAEGLRGQALLDVLSNMALVKENPELQKLLASFSKILSLAQSEEDKVLLESKIARVDFGSTPNPQIFIQAEIYGDESISEETKAKIEQSMGVPRLSPKYIETGSAVQRTAQTMTVDPETGESTPTYTDEHPAQIVQGVATYSETGKEVWLKAQIGDRVHRVDVSGWSAENVGLYAEALSFWAATERFGATSFVEDVYQLDFAVFEDALDPYKLIEIRQKITYLVGGFEGYDGDIFNPEEKKGLIRAQMRALNPSDTADGWEADRSQTRGAVKQLGLDNPIVLQIFGRYTQEHYASGEVRFDDVHQYLYRQFPDLVELPKNGETESSDR